MVEIPSFGLPMIEMASVDMPFIGETFLEKKTTTESESNYFTLGQSLLDGDDVLM